MYNNARHDKSISMTALLIILLCLINPFANAEGVWKEIHHIPGSHWHDVFFLDELHGWAVGDKGAIISTSDGGNNWKILHREYREIPLYSGCFFLSEKQGWIVGYTSLDGVIVSTNDGGITLEQHGLYRSQYFYDVCFVSPNEGWVVGTQIGQDFRVTMLHTKNAGKDWEVQDVSGLGILRRIFFIDDRNGFAVGPPDYYFQTDDGGKNWVKKHIPNIVEAWDVFFLNSNEGWISGFNSLIKTTNGGDTWQEIPIQAGNWLMSVRFKNSSEGFILAIDRRAENNVSAILQTKDGGNSFERQKETYAGLLSIAYIGDKCWVVGHDNTILYSDDGKNWVSQTENTYSFTDMDFVTKNKGFMVGISSFYSSASVNSVIFTTNDGGDNWEQVSEPIPESLSHIDFVDSLSGWIGGNKGFYHTQDAGKTMEKDNTISGIGDVVFPTKNVGWLVAHNGYIWRTSDGGRTWQKTIVDDKSSLGNIAVMGNKGWIIGYLPSNVYAIYKTEDGGKSFKKINVPNYLSGISFVTENNGWAVGWNAILATEDGGESWKKQLSDNGLYLCDVLALSEREVWAVGYTMTGLGTILRSNDGGKTWVTQTPRLIERINKIIYVGSDYLIAVGDWNTVLKYIDSSLLQYSNRFAVPDNKYLHITWGEIKGRLYQNYPNPFNPETWIPYCLSDATDVIIKIHNAKGLLVKTINLGHKQAGSYITKDKSAYWDGKNEAGEKVSSGVYFYTIEANGFSDTKKMLIME